MKLNRKIYLIGMVVGALLLLSMRIGLFFAMNHALSFLSVLDVSHVSDPALMSRTNGILLGTLLCGITGLLLLSLSTVFFLRGNRPGNP